MLNMNPYVGMHSAILLNYMNLLWIFFHLTQLGFFPRILKARSIGLIRIRRTHPFSDDAFNSAQLNPDELIQLIRKNYG